MHPSQLLVAVLGYLVDTPIDPAVFTRTGWADWNGAALVLSPEPNGKAYALTGADLPVPEWAVALAFDVESSMAAPEIEVSIPCYREDGEPAGNITMLNFQTSRWSMETWTLLESGFGRDPQADSRGTRYSPIGLPFTSWSVPTVALEFRVDGWDGTDWQTGTVTFSNLRWIEDLPDPPEFMRGDANSDGDRDIADAVAALFYLFAGTFGPPCLDAADTNDDGRVDLADTVNFLNWLFLDGAPPPEPILCGTDPTADTLRCGQGGDCE